MATPTTDLLTDAARGTCSVPEAGELWGVGRTKAFELARRLEAEGRVRRVRLPGCTRSRLLLADVERVIAESVETP